MYLDLYEKDKEVIERNRRVKFSYREFITSDFWRAQKEVWYSRHKKRCARCKSDQHINLHHKTYPKAGRYLALPDNAFVALCRGCHHRYHLKYGVRQNMQTTSNRFARSGEKKEEERGAAHENLQETRV